MGHLYSVFIEIPVFYFPLSQRYFPGRTGNRSRKDPGLPLLAFLSIFLYHVYCIREVDVIKTNAGTILRILIPSFILVFTITSCLSVGKGGSNETIEDVLGETGITVPRGFSDMAVSASDSGLSAGNDIIPLLYLESTFVEASDIKETCSILGGLVKAARTLSGTADDPRAALAQTLRMLDDDFGLRYREEKSINLVSLSLPGHRYDHDTGMFVFLAVAEELSWPLYPVRIPNRFILRWKDGRNAFDFDITTGEVLSDDDIRKRYSGGGKKFPGGMYFKAMGAREIAGVYYNALGLFAFHTFDYQAALGYFDRAASYAPGLAVIYNNRGNTFASLHRYEDAFSDHAEAISLNPFCATCYKNRGELNLLLERYDKAVRDFTAAIGLEPDNAEFPYLRGAVFFAMNEYERAEEDFTGVLLLDGNHVMALIYRGMTFFQRNQTGKAVDDFRRAYAIEPKSIMYVPDTLKGSVRKGK